MKSGLLNVIKFFAGFFQENTPESFGRLITLIVVCFVLGWDTSYVHNTHQLPDAMVMGAQVIFMTAFYGINKGVTAWANKNGSEEQK